MSTSQTDVTVIGAGAIGLATAWSLVNRGLSVTVVDSGSPRYGTSDANAGWVAPSHVIPFAAPGMVAMGAKSLLKRDGAFGIKPGASPILSQWTSVFVRHCTERHVDYAVPALTELLNDSITGISDLVDNHGLGRTVKDLWYIFSSANAKELAKHEVEHMQHSGVTAYEVDRDAALNEEPLLKETAKAVVGFGTDFGIDPKELLNVLERVCRERGVVFRTNEFVTGLNHSATKARVTTKTDSWESDYVVLAAGVWTREIAKSVGENLLIMPAKGHSVTLPNIENMPKRPTLLAEQRIATNGLDWGMRLSTGYVLTSPTDRSVEPKAIAKLLSTAREVFNLPDELPEINAWSGLRPSSPDGMPIIGPLTKSPRIIIASGHGMLGTMMSLGTGKLVADQVTHTSTSRESLKFLPSRPR